MHKNGEIPQLDYRALDTRPYSCNSRSQFLGHVNPMAGYNPHCPGVNFDHRIGATSTLAFWTISYVAGSGKEIKESIKPYTQKGTSLDNWLPSLFLIPGKQLMTECLASKVL